MSRKWRALALAACAALGTGACNKGQSPSGAGSEAVARVAGRPITRSYYEQRLAKMDRRFLPDTLDMAGKRKFLDFIINKEVMAQKAEEMKLGEDPRIAGNMKIYEDNLADKAAIDQITKGKLEPTDAEIDEFLAKKTNKILSKHILVKTKPEAEDLRKKLLGGANFDSLVSQYSIIPRTDANTGEPLPTEQRATFGEVQFGEAMIPVEDAVFSTKIGEVSEPVETGYGWHLFLPVSASQVKLPPADTEARRRVGVQIQMRRKRVLTEAYYEKICKAHGYRLDESVTNLIFDKLPVDVAPEQRPDPKTEVKPVIGFTREERDHELLQLDGKKYTVGDFSDKYDLTSWFERPKRITGALGLKYWLRDRWMKPLYLEQARKDGVYALPEVADEVKMRREQMMVTLLHENLIGSQAPEPTEEQLNAFYDKHRDVYVDPEKRTVNIIFNPQERVVRRADEEIKSGKDFVDVAVRYNESASKPEDIRTQPFAKNTPEFAPIASQAFALQKVGDMTEPFKTDQGWIIMQLATVEPQRPFLLDEIRENVVQDVNNQWSEDKLNSLLEEWKKNVKIDVDDEVLERVEVTRTDVYVPGRPAVEPGKAAAGSTP